MHIGFQAFAPSMTYAAYSATRMRGWSRSFGAQKNDVRYVWTTAVRLVRSKGPACSRSWGRRSADISGVRGTACQMPSVRQGEERASGISGGQPALHQAVCVL